ncbi:multidrug ABC transporter ATP-binding protein [Sulfurifustis variabilis]|uniref:Multidrug ABC transporter ATP-binding protein n=1 Tax=Sulfurifustis variabilis TaxID=1675686 RepID=A0A1B4V478_9GAMM|nr:ABC transporter ATP-binding protein [Sulfurifustis variabilis]BAU48340.1 multidrug ABC transporter ATP-binding protein [Sulfurifustis variabilis]
MNGAPAVEVANLTVKFGDFTAVDDISFTVGRGEIFGFLGANGAGKTTTIRVLCGLLPPTSGSVTVAGVGFETGEMGIKRRVGYMSQKFTLYDDLTVEENLSFIAALRKLDDATYRRRRDAILGFIAFDRGLDAFVRDMPGGVKQQVALAASMLHDPEIVFLDEPTAGVTPAARARFWALIRDLASQGKTMFVTTHNMDEAEQCERIALMRSGRIVALDTPAGLKGSTFPRPLYELEPEEEGAYGRMQALRGRPGLEYLEPYGLRFHAAFEDSPEGAGLMRELKRDFRLTEIAPTVEDVFIRRVEGREA